MPESITGVRPRLLEITVWHQEAIACGDCSVGIKATFSCHAEVLNITAWDETLLRPQRKHVLLPICDGCWRTAKYREAVYG